MPPWEIVSKTGPCAYHAQMSGGGIASTNADEQEHTQHNTQTSHMQITDQHNLPIQLRGGRGWEICKRWWWATEGLLGGEHTVQ